MRPFEEVLSEHGSVVMRVCAALLDPPDAEDAWSETFLAALEAYPRLRPGSNVRGWLVTIAHRKAIDILRARARAPLPAAEVPEPAGGTTDWPAWPASLVDRDPELWAALRALPFKQRGAVAYHYLAGLPYAEVGVLLESSEEAARRSAADGLARLRKTYSKKERKTEK
jgi:RNA polymerase sigma factor (sigma-70 family)